MARSLIYLVRQPKIEGVKKAQNVYEFLLFETFIFFNKYLFFLSNLIKMGIK